MKKILLPIDGSANSLKAVRHAVNRYLNHEQLEFHLLHVRRALSQYIGRFVRRADRLGYHRDEAEKVLEPARKLLAQFSIPYCVHVEVGKRAATIVRLAEKLGIAEIIIRKQRNGPTGTVKMAFIKSSTRFESLMQDGGSMDEG